MIVQTKLYKPGVSPVTVEVGEVGEVITAPPFPAFIVHNPVPTVGAFPAKVAVKPHIVWSAPAFAAVGAPPKVTLTVSFKDTQTPDEIVHTN